MARYRKVKEKVWMEEDEEDNGLLEDEENGDEVEEDEEDEEIQPYDQLEMIVDDFEDNIYDLEAEVREDIEVILDQLYSQHQVLQRVQAVFEQMTKKQLRPIKHFDRSLMDDLILAILCELPPDVCTDCGTYTQRCLCDSDEENDDLYEGQEFEDWQEGEEDEDEYVDEDE